MSFNKLLQATALMEKKKCTWNLLTTTLCQFLQLYEQSLNTVAVVLPVHIIIICIYNAQIPCQCDQKHMYVYTQVVVTFTIIIIVSYIIHFGGSFCELLHD